MDDTPPSARPARPRFAVFQVHWSLWVLAGVLVLIQVLLWSGHDGWSVSYSRLIAYRLVAVGPVPAAAEPLVNKVWFGIALVGHVLVHVSWLHLAINTLWLLVCGHVVQSRAGNGAFWTIFLVSALAGAVTFLALADRHATMIGASGAVFGLFAAVLRWRTLGIPGRRVVLMAVLVAAHLPTSFGVQVVSAWQAHLGGAVAGWILAGLFRPRTAPADSTP